MSNPVQNTIAAFQSELDFYFDWLKQSTDPGEREQLKAECQRIESQLFMLRIGGTFYL